MTGFENILQALIGGVGQPDELLWWIDDRALMRHAIARQAYTGVSVQQTADSITKRQGSRAIVKIDGVMVKSDAYFGETATSVVEAAINQAADDDDIDSILLSINSPGGSVAGLSELASAIVDAKTKKPVYAQSEGMIASAAYYVASQANKIFASKSDLVGSIGTRMLLYDFSKMFANLGIEAVPIDTGPLKSTGAMGTAITEQQKEYLQGIVNHFQADFAATVQRGRGFTPEHFATVASGGIFPAEQALQMKLIDGLQRQPATLATMPRRQAITSSKRRTAMSDQNTAAVEQEPATLSQLKKAFPKSTSEFREEQLEAEATLGQAQAAWSAKVTAENEQLRSDNERLTAELAAANTKLAEKPAPKAGKPLGNQPLANDGSASETTASARDQYLTAIQTKVATGMTREKAARAVARENPELRAAMVAQANA